MSQEERKADLINRIGAARVSSHWVCAADKLHLCASLLADLRRTEFPEMVWERQQHSREQTLRWYRSIHDKLRDSGFDAPIMLELGGVISELERFPLEK